MTSKALINAFVADNADAPEPGSGECIVCSDATSAPDYTVEFTRSGKTHLIGLCKNYTAHRAAAKADPAMATAIRTLWKRLPANQ